MKAKKKLTASAKFANIPDFDRILFLVLDVQLKLGMILVYSWKATNVLLMSHQFGWHKTKYYSGLWLVVTLPSCHSDSTGLKQIDSIP